MGQFCYDRNCVHGSLIYYLACPVSSSQLRATTLYGLTPLHTQVSQYPICTRDGTIDFISLALPNVYKHDRVYHA